MFAPIAACPNPRSAATNVPLNAAQVRWRAVKTIAQLSRGAVKLERQPCRPIERPHTSSACELGFGFLGGHLSWTAVIGTRRSENLAATERLLDTVTANV